MRPAFISSRRSLLDRVLKPIAPRPVAGFAPQPHEVAAGLWVLDRQLRFPGGVHLPSRTTILRLSDGALVVVSPPALLESGCAGAIDSLGSVEHVVVPNTFHYLYAAEFMDRYPDASLLVAPGLPGRAPELPPGQELGPRPPEAWSGEIDLAVLGPVRGVSEVALFHLPTGALILTDLAFNMTRFARSIDRAVWRLSGVPGGFGPARTARVLLLGDHAAASRCLSQVSRWAIRRIVVAHGEVIERDAKAQFLKAFAGYLNAPHAA